MSFDSTGVECQQTSIFSELIAQGALQIGDGYRAKNDELGGAGTIFLRAGHVRDTHIDFGGADRFQTTDNSKFKDKVSRSGDVVVTTKGNSTGRVAFVTRDMPEFVYSPHLSYWRSLDETRLCQGFLRAWSRGAEFRCQLDAMSRSTDMAPYLSLSDQKRLRITLLPVAEQREVAALLDELDDRITLLRETNATLEAIAQALFKSWFVDFDPVRAKQEGRVPDGMDPATAALFPDAFEESEFGVVPKGWRSGVIERLAGLNPESWTAKKHPVSIAYIDLANVKDNEISVVTNFSFDDAPSRARRVMLHGDTIVGTVRPGNRSFAYISKPIENLTASTGFAVLRPTRAQNAEFVYLAATRNSSIEHLAHVADGGAYPAVRPEVVASLQCCLPSDAVMDAFHEVAEPLLVTVAENQERARTLAALRDTLLPRLISGQLRLPEAEAEALAA